MRESTNFFSGHRYEKKKENAFFGVDASFAICVICVEFLGLKVSDAKKCFSGFGQSGMRSSWTHALAIYSRDKDRKMGTGRDTVESESWRKKRIIIAVTRTSEEKLSNKQGPCK